jgi:serine/threonine protein kinase
MIDDSLIGRQLANFRFERVIGRGGMGVVYFGADVLLHRPVAIKVIDARYRHDPAYTARLVREARAVAAWRHENIVQVYYAGEEAGLTYFAMEYVDGPDLGKEIARHAAADQLMPRHDVLRIGRAVAAALDYAHERGVIHRDVKPSNVLLADDGRVVLTDFGVAVDTHRESASEVIGTAHYMSPEQARRATDVVPQSDLYSLGVILYELLTGAVPFDDLSSTTVALQHLTQPPPPPREINPRLNVETERVLLRALHKSPSKRYASGKTLIDALDKALPASRSVTRRPKALPTQPSRTQQAAAAPTPDTLGADLVGRQLDEYRVDALLGRGGMARIYRGFDTRNKRHVAIKVIDTRFQTDPTYLARFEREARAIAQLDHPGVVKLYHYGEADGRLYMAMQLIEGENLHALLAAHRNQRKRLPPKDMRRIVRDVCAALDYIHGRGVIHRDVKPSNVVFDRRGRAVLADFGLALLAETETRGEIFGSPHYVAPEQAMSSANASPQSDLYSVGVILYEMVTGQLPFDAPDPLDIALLHMTEPPPAPRSVRPDVSPALEAMILKALAKEPADRYPSGAALADALDQALEGRPAKALTPAPKAPRPLPPPPAAVAKPAPAKTAPKKAAGRAVPVSPTKKKRRWLPFVIGLVGIGVLVAAAFVFLSNGLIANPFFVQPTSIPAAAIASPTRTPTAEPTATNTAPPPTATPSTTSAARPTATPTLLPTATPTLVAAALPGETASATPTPTPVPPTPTPTIFKNFIPLVMKNHRAQ